MAKKKQKQKEEKPYVPGGPPTEVEIVRSARDTY
jgi:hypothetical protein